MPYLRLWFLFCVIWFAIPAWGMEAYRCISPEGRVSFQQSPCRNEGEKILLKPAQAAWSPLSAEEKALYQTYLKADKKRAKKRRRALRAKSKKRSEKRESRACWNKRRQYERARARLRSGYKAGEGARLRRMRDAAQDYLSRFCGPGME